MRSFAIHNRSAAGQSEGLSARATASINASRFPAIVLFDGVCNLCNSSINYIIDHDPRGYFRFASQQSAVGQSLLRQLGMWTDEPLSIVLIENRRHYIRSEAALRVARKLSGWPRLASLAIAIPPFFRDATYDFIAKNRYRWFGKLEACRMPTPQRKARFIDSAN